MKRHGNPALKSVVYRALAGTLVMATLGMEENKIVRLLERRFHVRAPLEIAWTHLAMVEKWPSWARHIRRIDLYPAGSLSSQSEGVIQLTTGIRCTFKVEELNAGHNWRWVGPFLWLTVHYDHQFSKVGPHETEVGFVVEGEGLGIALFGRVFAAIYARSLDRAIPNLIRELDHKAVLTL